MAILHPPGPLHRCAIGFVMILYYNYLKQSFNRMLKINYNRNNQLHFRSISHLDEKEASEIVNLLNVGSNNKNAPKEENMIIRNGVLRKMESNDFHFLPQDTKVLAQSRPLKDSQDKSYRIIESSAREDRKRQGQKMQRKPSWINELRNESSDQSDRLKEDYCRIWYEKLALESSYNQVLEETAKKDELINQLKLQLQLKNNPNQGNIIFNIPNNNANHHQSHSNKTISNNHPHFSIQPPANQASPWPNIPQNRNFQQPNNNFRNNF